MKDFFEQQEAARRATGLLIAYFVLCVACIVVAVYLAVVGFPAFLEAKEKGHVTISLWDPRPFAGVSIVTLVIIALGSLYKVRTLSGGGMAVARMLGGRPVEPGTANPEERVLVNVVEEMAIASGMTVPPVYLLPDQQGINAFAAGYTPGSAVIGVTRGTMERLSRDELQGVIGHEFSHILSGDMRLNIRLMGVIHGILVISIIGRVLMRTRGRKNPLPLLGLGLYLIGLIGVLFGRLIKAAVSRQREFLADAASVQFTRNPGGIAGALKKIGGLPRGSRIDHALAEEMSHFYFSNGLKASWMGLLSTHPDLSERIRRIDPTFDGTFPKLSAEPAPALAFRPEAAAEKLPRVQRVAIDALSAVARVGAPGLEHLAWAAALIASLPPDIAVGVRDPTGAQAVIFALLLSCEPEVERAQMDSLKASADPAIVAATVRFAPRVRTLGPEYRLPLVEMAMPALAAFSEKNFSSFCERVSALVAADRKVDLFEFMLERMLLHQRDVRFRKRGRESPDRRPLSALRKECAVLISALARTGGKDEAAARTAFGKGWKELHLPGEATELLPGEASGFEAVGKALDALAGIAPAMKKGVMAAGVACVAADRTVTVEEAELIRAMAAVLDCPMPPILGRAAT